MTERIKLSGVPETMLQTIYARAKERQAAVRFVARRGKRSSAT